MLLMKKEFFNAIRSGDKTTTLRWWRWRRVKPGSVHVIPGLGPVQIEQVRCIDESELVQADALADGLASLEDLHRVVADMYPPHRREGRRLYQVRFRLLSGPAGKKRPGRRAAVPARRGGAGG